MPSIATRSNPKWISAAWLCVGLLWVVAFLNYLDRVMLTTMRQSIEAAVPMTDAQFGLLTSIFLWVYGIVSPLAGFAADRFSRRGIIIVGLLIWSVVTWLTGHAANFEQLLATRALMGVSEAFYIPAAMAMIVDYHRGATRSLASGIHLSGFMVGSGLGGLGGWLAERHGWNFAFNFFGLIGISYVCVLFLLLREPARESAANGSNDPNHAPEKIRFFHTLGQLLGSGTFLLALAYWGLLGLAGWGIVGWMPTFFGEQFHLSEGAAGLSATAYLQIAALVGVILGGWLADKETRRTDERGRITVCMIGMCLAAPGILLLAQTSIFSVAIAGLMLYGLTRAFADTNMMPILCLVCDSRYRATGYGVLNSFACFVGGLTIYAGGWLRDAHIEIRHIFELASGGMLLCGFLLLVVRRAIKPRVMMETSGADDTAAS